jgi:deoxyadenosine/deoxycytidine kinase
MIIMLNGAFGVGKSSAAEALTQSLPNSMLYDPEEVGAMVRRITQGVREGNENTDDYQDIALWRSLTIDVAQRLRKKYKRTLIIPMTITRLEYFREIKQGLARLAPDLHHFCLTASIHTIHQRLEERGMPNGSWAHQQTERCLQAFQSAEFKELIDMEHRNPHEVADLILNQIRP